MTDISAPTLAPGSLVTVIGGAGFIGRYVVEALAKAGYRVRAVSRHADSALFLKPLGDLGQIQVVSGNIRSDADMAAAFAGAAAGVNLVGILAESGDQRFADLQAAGAGRAARAASAAGVSAYVQVSAIGADAASPIPYARSKGEGEQAVLAALPFATILRPSLVAGPEDQFFNRFAGMARIAPFLPAISGDSLFQPVYVRDVADAVLAALQSADARGRTYELGGPNVLSFTAILQMISDLTGLDRPVVPLSDFTSGLLAKMGDVLPFMPMNSDQLAMLKKGNICAPGVPGLADLGVTPTPLSGFVPDMMLRFRRGGRFAKAAQDAAA
ncbi:complex I NDUFA9 subunit family protein [Sandarakinorhabdus oryzae]|uniref:complex I NDUFA9 subunit family protein n=1 Tax=Sandarakinorhabdus oryzae TaxID=2675220 RepID=UPI0012E19E29|nr:complex I NDUFA9 subunit family protein [Sandarakinorhabdus oryzae]